MACGRRNCLAANCQCKPGCICPTCSKQPSAPNVDSVNRGRSGRKGAAKKQENWKNKNKKK
jgi:hypothetical protein